MADVLGTMSSVVELVDQSCRLYLSIKGANEKVKGLETNMLRLKGLLQRQVEALQRDNLTEQDKAEIGTLVEEARALLEASTAFLSKTTSLDNNGRRKMTKMDLLVWPVHSSESTELDQKFATFFRVHSAVHDSLVLYVYCSVRCTKLKPLIAVRC